MLKNVVCWYENLPRNPITLFFKSGNPNLESSMHTLCLQCRIMKNRVIFFLKQKAEKVLLFTLPHYCPTKKVDNLIWIKLLFSFVLNWSAKQRVQHLTWTSMWSQQWAKRRTPLPAPIHLHGGLSPIHHIHCRGCSIVVKLRKKCNISLLRVPLKP